MKKKIAKILSIIMICCISLLCVGCMGTVPGDYDGNSGGSNFSEGNAFDMYGAKVLYRPDSYDYNSGSGAASGETNDYYGKYAYLILRDLNNTYGIINETTVKDSGLSISEYNLPYLYDSIRYQVDTLGTVTKTKAADGSETTLEAENQFIVVGADTNAAWEWNFEYDLQEIENGRYDAFLYNEDYYKTNPFINSNYYAFYNNGEYFKNNIQSYYQSTINTQYTQIYLGTATETDTANYSDLVKALEYVVYSYALDLEPAGVDVEPNKDATSIENLYEVTVEGYENVDKALAEIKTLFNKIGSYVGLIKRQIRKISAWIKTNVIGEAAMADDTFTTYQNVTQVTDENGNISYKFDEATKSTTDLGRDYDIAVDNIVNNVCDNVSIGQEEGGGDVTIDNSFLASYVKEYAGNTFFIAGDENFPAPGTTDAVTAIQPLEYQSVQLMLKEDEYIGDIWIALKYDAGLDGTEKGVYDFDKYIDIIVEINYYNNEYDKLFTVGSKRTRVYDGPYKGLLEKNKYGLPDDHGTLFFSNFAENCIGENKDYIDLVTTKNGNLKVEAFKPENFPMTDVGESGYCGTPLVSTQPLKITGLSNTRKYYELIEPVEALDNNLTYITGRSKSSMYAGDNGCDYIEITYKVLKKKGDNTTNYKFYTGIAAVIDPLNP